MGVGVQERKQEDTKSVSLVKHGVTPTKYIYSLSNKNRQSQETIKWK